MERSATQLLKFLAITARSEDAVMLELRERDVDVTEIKKQIRGAASACCEGRNFSSPIKRLTLSERDDSDFAMILPIDARRLFKGFLIGSRVTPQAESSAVQSLRSAGVNCSARRLDFQP